MTIYIPTILQDALIRNFSYQDHDVDSTKTPMESGTKRKRLRTKHIPSDFGCMFLFDQTQLGVLDYFYQDVLKSGTLEFEMYLRTGQGLILHTVKFSQPPTSKRTGIKYSVAFALEAPSRPTS